MTEVKVKLSDGGPWGFRLSGGADYGCPLQVAKLRVNSKSYNAGLLEGDVIMACNDENLRLASHHLAMRMIERAGDNLTLTVLRSASDMDAVYTSFVNQEKESHVLSRDREPSVSKAYITIGRSPSPARSLRVITSRPSSPARATNLLKIDDRGDMSRPPVPGRPAVSPYQASLVSLPVRSSSVPRSDQSLYSQPLSRSYQPEYHSSSIELSNVNTPLSFSNRSNNQPVIVRIKPLEVSKPNREEVTFRVRNISAPKVVWKPTEESATSAPQSNTVQLYIECNKVVPSFAQRVASEPNTGVDNTKQPAQFYWELMENQPDHMPGYNDPLIVDDTQGDFGGNPIIRPDRNTYSDSTFFDTKDHRYPTIPEQMKLCREISSKLHDADSMRSKGGRMFHKRRANSDQFALESRGRKEEREFKGDNYLYEGHWPDAMKHRLTTDELERFEHNTVNMSKHDLLPPVVAFDINTALKHNHGRAKEIFARNKERADQFTVDENNRMEPLHQNVLRQQLASLNEVMQNYKSPWNAANEGNLERAFSSIDPFAARSCAEEPGLRRDENLHKLDFNHQHGTFGVKYKDVMPVAAPKGPLSRSAGLSRSMSCLNEKREEPRLAKMIKSRYDEPTTYDTYTYKWCMPSYYTKDGAEGTLIHGQSLGNLSAPPAQPVILRRPKEYVANTKRHTWVDTDNEEPAFDWNELAPPTHLQRPNSFYPNDPISSF